MPNWVKHKVTVEGSKKSIESFIKKHFTIENKEDTFDFNTLVPMPENIFKGDLGTKEREQYGTSNWYDWSIENWGTKWNACHTTMGGVFKSRNGRGYNFSFEFDTAWSTPMPIFYAIAEKYEDIYFFVEYADEDVFSNNGTIEIYNKELIRDEINEESHGRATWGMPQIGSN